MSPPLSGRRPGPPPPRPSPQRLAHSHPAGSGPAFGPDLAPVLSRRIPERSAGGYAGSQRISLRMAGDSIQANNGVFYPLVATSCDRRSRRRKGRRTQARRLDCAPSQVDKCNKPASPWRLLRMWYSTKAALASNFLPRAVPATRHALQRGVPAAEGARPASPLNLVPQPGRLRAFSSIDPSANGWKAARTISRQS
jgi:hypothetical protein